MMRSKVYHALQAVVCIALVILLSVSAVEIYQEGSARKAEDPMENIYTPEAAAGKFAPIAPLFFAGLGLMIAGLVLGVKDKEIKGFSPLPPEGKRVICTKKRLSCAIENVLLDYLISTDKPCRS